jgi:Glycosyl transferase family 2
MPCQITILVVPRDRFSSAVACVKSIVENTDIPYKLVVIDFGYSKRTLDDIRRVCGSQPVTIEAMGQTIPMVALKRYLPNVDTKYLAWVDNDTYVTPNWLVAALDRARAGARVILPVTLEREGLDIDPRKIPLRNHISHGELRKVNIDGEEFVFDYKPFRRAAPEELPKEAHTVDFFEFHAVVAETDVLRQLDIPEIVMREHVDIGMQLAGHPRRDVPSRNSTPAPIAIWCEPRSIVHFDNIHERPTYRDLRYFFYRWGRHYLEDAHRQFERRWGFKYTNEQFIKNWAFRRKVFSVGRFIGIPHKLADFISRGMGKLFCKPIPKQFLGNPLPQSSRVLETQLETEQEPGVLEASNT